jgi:FMN phosphatase YigB (HAD superfamily)
LVRSVHETGAFLGAVLACVSPRAVRIIAKPGPALFEESFRRLSVAPADCVMIGNSADNDVSGAERVGIRTLLVAKAQGASADDLHQLMDRLASWGVL